MEDLYYSLRGEIRYNQEQENIICMFCYTTCVAMLAFAYSEHVEMVAFLSQFAFLPFAYRVGRLRDSTAYISTYMYKVLEPNLENIKWETDHQTYRDTFGYSKSLLVIASRIDFLFLSIISMFSFWIIYFNRISTLVSENEHEFVCCTKSTLEIFKVVYCDIGYLVLLVVLQLTCLGFMIAYTILYSNVDNIKNIKEKNWESLIIDHKLAKENSDK